MKTEPSLTEPQTVATESLEEAAGGTSYQTACVDGSKLGAAIGLTAGLLTGAPIAGFGIGAIAGCVGGMAGKALDD